MMLFHAEGARGPLGPCVALLEIRNLTKPLLPPSALSGVTSASSRGSCSASSAPTVGQTTLSTASRGAWRLRRPRALSREDITPEPRIVYQRGSPGRSSSSSLAGDDRAREHAGRRAGKDGHACFPAGPPQETRETARARGCSVLGIARLETTGLDLSYGQQKLSTSGWPHAPILQLILLEEPMAGVNPR